MPAKLVQILFTRVTCNTNLSPRARNITCASCVHKSRRPPSIGAMTHARSICGKLQTQFHVNHHPHPHPRTSAGDVSVAGAEGQAGRGSVASTERAITIRGGATSAIALIPHHTATRTVAHTHAPPAVQGATHHHTNHHHKLVATINQTRLVTLGGGEYPHRAQMRCP